MAFYFPLLYNAFFFLGREILHIFLVLLKVTYFAYVHIPTIIYTLLGGILAFLGNINTPCMGG